MKLRLGILAIVGLVVFVALIWPEPKRLDDKVREHDHT
jgi:hypothetical protein